MNETSICSFLDHWGPSHVLQVYDPRMDMQGLLIVDNTSLGPGLGGIMVSHAFTPREMHERARAKTWTCALLDIGFGGAAAGIRADPSAANKADLIRSFARMIAFSVPWLYIATPDLNAGQAEMATFADEVGDWQGATGKPERMQGIPHELGVVSFGIGVAIESCLSVADPRMHLPGTLAEAKVAIQGHGDVGITLAKYLAHKGASLVAICDEDRTIHDPQGIDVESIPRDPSGHVEGRIPGRDEGARVLPVEDISKVECDLLVCTTDRLTLSEDTIKYVQARCIVEGAPVRLSPTTQRYLHKHGVLVLPDLVVAAGGTISSFAEYQGISTERAFSMIESRIGNTMSTLIQGALQRDEPVRKLAEETAKERLAKAMEAR